MIQVSIIFYSSYKLNISNHFVRIKILFQNKQSLTCLIFDIIFSDKLQSILTKNTENT